MYALMTPMLKAWMDQFSIILEHPVQPEDPEDWGIKMEVSLFFSLDIMFYSICLVT